MQIYHYHETTGVYLGTSEAMRDPLDADNFIIPACATPKKPRAPKEGNQSRFTGEKWISEKIPEPEPEFTPPPPPPPPVAPDSEEPSREGEPEEGNQ